MEAPHFRPRFIALWAVHRDFLDLSPRRCKLFPPPSLIKWRHLNPEQKKRMEFDNSPEVDTYLKESKWVDQQNKDNKLWLQNLKQWLDPVEDAEEILQVKDKLFEYSILGDMK